MTTYAYTIILDDSEIIMMKAALELMIEHCQKKLDDGEGAPYWAHRHSARNVLERLYFDKMQMSGNSFFNKKPKDDK